MKRTCLLLMCLVLLFGTACSNREKNHSPKPDAIPLAGLSMKEHYKACTVSNDTAPAFINRYDSVTDENLDDFINDWHEYSMNIARQTTPEVLINNIFCQEFYCLGGGNDTSMKYVVLPLRIEIFYKNRLLNIKNARNAYRRYTHYKYYDEKAFTPFITGQWQDSITRQENILYLTDGIYQKLAEYLGGIESDVAPINKKHYNHFTKKHYFSIDYGHWGGYWHLETMPKIYCIYLFKNCAYVCSRTSWSTGEDHIYFKTNNCLEREEEPVSYWVE